MLIEHFHQGGVCVREILKLPGKLVLPLDAVKEVVAIPKDNDQDGRDPIPVVIFAAIDHRTHHVAKGVGGKVQMLEMMGDRSAFKISRTEIGEFGFKHWRIQCAFVLPMIDGVAYGAGTASGIQDAGLKQAPQEREVRNRVNLFYGQMIEAGRSGLQPSNRFSHTSRRFRRSRLPPLPTRNCLRQSHQDRPRSVAAFWFWPRHTICKFAPTCNILTAFAEFQDNEAFNCFGFDQA